MVKIVVEGKVEGVKLNLTDEDQLKQLSNKTLMVREVREEFNALSSLYKKSNIEMIKINHKKDLLLFAKKLLYLSKIHKLLQ